MNKTKILHALSASVKLLSLAGLLSGYLSVAQSVAVLAIASGLKDLLLTLGDYLDDGQLNKSFAALAIGALLLGTSGCVQYVDPSGQRLTSFLQKSTFEGLRVSPKTGLSIKSAETSGDADFIRSVYEAGKAAAKEVPK